MSPTIAAITPPSNGTYGSGQNVDFTISWSEAVTISGTPRISLTVGASGVNANYVSGSGSASTVFRYVVGPSDNDSDGIVATSPVNLNSGSIADAAGNAATLSFTPPSMTGVLVDSSAPAISSVVPPSNANYATGNNLDFSVNWSETVNVVGSPRIALTVGSTTRYATYYNGTGTASTTFRYTVQSGDSDSDGIVAISPIDLNGGTIRDTSSNDAGLTFSPPSMGSVWVNVVCVSGSNAFTGGGADTFVVPAGCTQITVKAWGGGGGGGGGSSNSACGGSGGGGGFARGTITVTPGETLTISVGGGGSGGQNSGNGGNAGVGYGGSVALGSAANTGTPGGSGSGGGGGAGGGANTSGTNGAAGGGGGGASGILRSGTWLIRGAGGGGGGGGGGNSTAGSAGGPGGPGNSGGGSPGANASTGGTGDTGAGGGGGGGTGSSYSGTATGGSGGLNLVSGSSTSNINGSGNNPANTGDPNYSGSAGLAGSGNCSASTGGIGINGRVHISW